MKLLRMEKIVPVLLALALIAPAAQAQSPPFDYVPAVFPFLITGDDPSAYTGIEYKRRESLEDGPSYVFHASYSDAGFVKMTASQNEYSQNDASYFAEYIGEMLGRLPAALRDRVERINLRRRDSGSRGIMYVVPGTGTINVLTDGIENQIDECGDEFLQSVYGCPIEEIFLHELGHIVQERIENSIDWEEAKNSDNNHISDYGTTNASEDIAESVVAWVGLQIPEKLYPNFTDVTKTLNSDIAEEVRSTIGYRLEFLDSLFLPEWERSSSSTESAEILEQEVSTLQGIVSLLEGEISALNKQTSNLQIELDLLQQTELVSTYDIQSGRLRIPRLEFDNQFYEVVLEMAGGGLLEVTSLLHVAAADSISAERVILNWDLPFGSGRTITVPYLEGSPEPNDPPKHNQYLPSWHEPDYLDAVINYTTLNNLGNYGTSFSTRPGANIIDEMTKGDEHLCTSNEFWNNAAACLRQSVIKTGSDTESKSLGNILFYNRNTTGSVIENGFYFGFADGTRGDFVTVRWLPKPE